MQGMSEREYAGHAGLSRGAIQKVKTSGRLVLHADGSIDAAASDARRAAATDPSKSRPAKMPEPKERLKPVPDTAVSAVGETLREHGLAAPALSRSRPRPRSCPSTSGRGLACGSPASRSRSTPAGTTGRRAGGNRHARGVSNPREPMQFLTGCWRPRLAGLMVATGLLAACATGGSEPATAVCPPVAEYSAEFQARAAEEMLLLPETSAIAEMLGDDVVGRIGANGAGSATPSPARPSTDAADRKSGCRTTDLMAAGLLSSVRVAAILTVALDPPHSAASSIVPALVGDPGSLHQRRRLA